MESQPRWNTAAIMLAAVSAVLALASAFLFQAFAESLESSGGMAMLEAMLVAAALFALSSVLTAIIGRARGERRRFVFALLASGAAVLTIVFSLAVQM